jgi:hypothetical protein
MLADARRHDSALRAQLTLNHQELFTAQACAEARQTLNCSPLPQAKAATQARERQVASTAVAPVEPGAQSAACIEGRRSLPEAPVDPEATLSVLRESGLWRDEHPLRLHLGCGERRLDGYVNVDLPPTGDSLMASMADVFGDVARLRFPESTVDEVRSHHMFERFPRVQALALLIRWQEWLRTGGRVVIETPDIEGSARTLLSGQPLAVKMGVVRHLAGDQAEAWAFHVDHWFPDRFRHTLERLGFHDIAIERQSWPNSPYLSNIVVAATKIEGLSREELLDRADDLLEQSLVAASEGALLERWRRQLRAALSDAVAGDDVAAAFEAPGCDAESSSKVLARGARGELDPIAWIAARGSPLPLREVVNFNQLQRDRWVAQRKR